MTTYNKNKIINSLPEEHTSTLSTFLSREMIKRIFTCFRENVELGAGQRLKERLCRNLHLYFIVGKLISESHKSGKLA